jgi:hypothetical protein
LSTGSAVVRSRPHALHVEAPQAPDRCGTASSNIIVSVPRVSPSASQVWFSRHCFVRLWTVRPTARCVAHRVVLLLFVEAGFSWSRFHGPLSSFPEPTGRSLVVHLCTSRRGASRCIQISPSPLRCGCGTLGQVSFQTSAI